LRGPTNAMIVALCAIYQQQQWQCWRITFLTSLVPSQGRTVLPSLPFFADSLFGSNQDLKFGTYWHCCSADTHKRENKVKNFLPLSSSLFVSAALLFGNNLSNLEQSTDHEILPNFKLIWKGNKHFENMEDVLRNLLLSFFVMDLKNLFHLLLEIQISQMNDTQLKK